LQLHPALTVQRRAHVDAAVVDWRRAARCARMTLEKAPLHVQGAIAELAFGEQHLLRPLPVDEQAAIGAHLPDRLVRERIEGHASVAFEARRRQEVFPTVGCHRRCRVSRARRRALTRSGL
jgi:hypothetical protein